MHDRFMSIDLGHVNIPIAMVKRVYGFFKCSSGKGILTLLVEIFPYHGLWPMMVMACLPWVIAKVL